MRAALQESDEVRHFDDEVWKKLAQQIYYCGGDASEEAAYQGIEQKLNLIEKDRAPEDRNRFFYLAVPPSVFQTIVRHLASSGLVPRGHDGGRRARREGEGAEVRALADAGIDSLERRAGAVYGRRGGRESRGRLSR